MIHSAPFSQRHYTVMEHILTCHEAVPYLYANPDTGEQQEIELGGVVTDCSEKPLDTKAFVVVDGVKTDIELNYEDPFNTFDENGVRVMYPNDNTDVLNDIAVTDDFSVTLKDDGKVHFVVHFIYVAFTTRYSN